VVNRRCTLASLVLVGLETEYQSLRVVSRCSKLALLVLVGLATRFQSFRVSTALDTLEDI
jgi:hypothetical protein